MQIIFLNSEITIIPMGLNSNDFHLISMDENKHREIISKLFYEYFSWAYEEALSKLNIRLFEEFAKNSLENYIQRLLSNLSEYSPPDGSLLLVEGPDNKIVGLGALKKLHLEDGEIKRMFVNPKFRGLKLGKKILTGLIQEAKNKGYKTLYLDSVVFMITAQNMYKSFGFQEIQPYEGTEIPVHIQKYWKYMKLPLQ